MCLHYLLYMKNGVNSIGFGQIPKDFVAELQRFARVLAGFEPGLMTGYAQILSQVIPSNPNVFHYFPT